MDQTDQTSGTDDRDARHKRGGRFLALLCAPLALVPFALLYGSKAADAAEKGAMGNTELFLTGFAPPVVAAAMVKAMNAGADYVNTPPNGPGNHYLRQLRRLSLTDSFLAAGALFFGAANYGFVVHENAAGRAEQARIATLPTVSPHLPSGEAGKSLRAAHCVETRSFYRYVGSGGMMLFNGTVTAERPRTGPIAISYQGRQYRLDCGP